MSQQETVYETIELYVSGGLSEKDKLAFEQELALRPDWQQKVDAYRLTNQMVLENYLMDIKETLSEVHKKNESGKGKKTTLYSAGLLLVAGGVASWYFSTQSTLPVIAPQEKMPQTNLSSKESQPLVKVKPKKEVVVERASSVKETTASISSLPVDTESPNVSTIQETSPEVPPIEAENKAPQSILNESFVEIKILDPCAHVALEASIFTTSTCKGEEKGSVVLSAFKGGKAPYKWSLKDVNRQSVATSGLPKGMYHAILSDAQNCFTTIPSIEVKEKHCDEAHHFNPFIGEKWEIPSQTVSGNLTILDKSGNVYFSADLPAGSQEYWTGESAQGELKTGLYLYTITHSGGLVTRGTVSIVR